MGLWLKVARKYRTCSFVRHATVRVPWRPFTPGRI